MRLSSFLELELEQGATSETSTSVSRSLPSDTLSIPIDSSRVFAPSPSQRRTRLTVHLLTPHYRSTPVRSGSAGSLGTFPVAPFRCTDLTLSDNRSSRVVFLVLPAHSRCLDVVCRGSRWTTTVIGPTLRRSVEKVVP